jgi:hypothetical protein
LVIRSEEEVGACGGGEGVLGIGRFAGVERDRDGVEFAEGEKRGEPVGAVGAGEDDPASGEGVRCVRGAKGFRECAGAGGDFGAGEDLAGGGVDERAGLRRGGDGGLPDGVQRRCVGAGRQGREG